MLDGLAPIVAETTDLADAFVAGGHRLYLVGGIVRDLIGGNAWPDEADLDFTTDANPEEIKAIVAPLASALWLQGERFGTVGAQIAGRDHEITTHRSESYENDSRKPSVSFATAITEDLARRDFTVNAMAVELPGAELLDPFDGQADLSVGSLRTPLDPEISFTDDPLRMLRAARFAAGYGLAPTPELVAAMQQLADRLDIVSAERIRDELDKLLATAEPSIGLTLLSQTGVLERVLPELSTASAESNTASAESSTASAESNTASAESNTASAESNTAIDQVFARVDSLHPDPALRLAGLLHSVPRDQTERRLRALRYSNERRGTILGITASARTLEEGRVSDQPGLRRWVHRSGEDREGARQVVAAFAPDGARLVERSAELEAELATELDNLEPPLTGDEVMEYLGMTSGPTVGDALAALQEAAYEAGPLTSESAHAILDEWWAGRTNTGRTNTTNT